MEPSKRTSSPIKKTGHLGPKKHMFYAICIYVCVRYVYIYIYSIIFGESLTKAICTLPKRCPETIPSGTSQALEALKAVQPPIVHAQQMLSVPRNPDLMLTCQVYRTPKTNMWSNRTERLKNKLWPTRDLIVLAPLLSQLTQLTQWHCT